MIFAKRTFPCDGQGKRWADGPRRRLASAVYAGAVGLIGFASMIAFVLR